MRLLKFIGVFLAVFIVIAALIIIPSLKSVRTIIKNYDTLNEGTEWIQQVATVGGFLNYIDAHPGHISIYSSTPGLPDSTLDYNGEKMRPIGTLSTLVSVAEYAHLVDNGTWHSNDSVPLDSINQYQLPGVYFNTHQKALSQLPGKDKKNGSIELQELVRMAIQGQDLPASDYLFWKIGPVRLDSTLKKLGIKDMEPPLPWTGLYITINPAVNNKSVKKIFTDLSGMSREQQRQVIIDNARRFKNDPAFHHRVIEAFKNNGTSLSFAQERTAYSYLSQASAKSLVQLVNKAWADSLYSTHASKIFLNTLQWKDMVPLMHKVFSWYGSSFDNRMSLLSGVDVGTASRFGYTRIQAMVLDSLPIQLWLHLSSQFSNQTFQRRLIWDPAFFEMTYRRLILHQTIIDSEVISTKNQ